ncbi:MAG: hypothetical protein JXB47_00385 [Anaerolineae bacterium]|nr:hypothetical protein [Anaerolineae bacterium]
MSDEPQRSLSRAARLSEFLNARIDWLSNFLSKYRGIPMMLAVLLIALNLFLVILDSLTQGTVPLLVFLVSTNCCLHLGLIIGFVGILLAEPLGRG